MSWFDGVAFHSVLSGLCPLLPVPVVDSLLLQRVKKSMTRGLATDVGVVLGEPQVAVLAGAVDLDPGRGCLGGCLLASWKIGIALAKRTFKKILFVLTFKEVVDEATKAFHEGVLLHHALTAHRSALPTGEDERQQGARRLRKAIDDVLLEGHGRGIRDIVAGVLRGGKQALLEGARLLGSRDEIPVEAERGALGGVTERLREALWKEQETMALLRARLDARLLDTPVGDH